MYEPALTGLGAGMGGAAGAGAGVLGRSPLLSLLAPLDYPRQAAWNLVRGPARLLQGEGSLDDILGMVPGLAGAGMAALGPLGLLGGALAGGAVQGLGKLTGSDAFEASTPQDVTGSEDFLPNLAVGAATDPLTFSGLGMGGQAGRMAGSRMAMHAAEPALAEGPEGILQAFRMGLPQGGVERDAAVAGLSGRNQALGEAVGQVAQGREARPANLAGQVLQQPQHGQFVGPPLEGALTPEDIRQFEQMGRGTSPEQAFEQMLPLAAKEQRIGRAIAADRNELPGFAEGFDRNDVMGYGLNNRVADLTDPRRFAFEATQGPAGEHIPLGMSPDQAAQLRRWAATQRALRTTQGQLEQYGPLASELTKTGQLGPIEGRLQMNWAMLGDMAQEGRLSPEQLVQQARAAQLEDEAFQTLFERVPHGTPPQWAGQQALLGQVEPGELAGHLRTSLNRGLAQHAEQQIRPLEAELTSGNYLPAGRFDALGDQIHALRRQQSEALSGRAGDTPNFWAPGTPVPPTGPPPFPGGSVGSLSGAPALPSLEQALAQAQTNIGRPLQGWENQQLEQTLAGRNPQPLQERGILGDLGATPRDVNPPLPRGVSLEAHTLTPSVAHSAELDEAIQRMYGQNSPGWGHWPTPNSVLGLHRLEQQLGRPLTEAEVAWLQTNYR